MKEKRPDSGLWGEKIAARALKEKKYKILDRRVRVGPRDEIDILARNGDVLVFVEVKTRAKESFGRPISFVDANKRRALSRAAVRYLKKLRKMPPYFRFDVVEVVGREGDECPDVRHIENAFNLDKRYTLSY